MMMTMLATTAQAQSPNGTATASAAEVSASVLASLPGCGVCWCFFFSLLFWGGREEGRGVERSDGIED